VLDAIRRKSRPSFTDILPATGLNKATLSRILSSLEELGFLERAPDRTYSVGPFVLQLARSALKRDCLSKVSERYARALAEDLHELVTIGTIRGGRRYNLAKATVERSITVDADLHLRPSPFNTATGRAMLAHVSEDDLDLVIRVNGLPGDAWPGVSTKRDLERELRAIRDGGHATCVSPDGEAEAIAVPVLGPDGEAWASLGVGIPRYRLTERRRTTVLVALGRAAGAMADELSFELSAVEEGAS
jgi:DNA-binding IclR family transcriptional regulator